MSVGPDQCSSLARAAAKFGDPNYKLVSDLTNDIGWCQITETKAWAAKDGVTSGL
jgi:hypothetical protein